MRRPDSLQDLLSSYSEVLFLPQWLAGACVAALVWVSPAVGIGGLVGLLVASLLMATFLRKWPLPLGNAPRLNAILTGMSVGFFFGTDGTALLMMVLATCLAAVATAVLAHILFTHFRLPVLSLPFAMVATIVYFAGQHYGRMQVPVIPWEWQLHPWVESYFRSLGTLFFMPNAVVGAIIAALLVLRSPMLFLFSLHGFVVGVCLQGALLGQLDPALQSYLSFNYILTAMGFGCVFLVYSRYSFLAATAGVGFCVLLVGAMEVFALRTGVPLFTTPFNLTLMLGLYAVGVARPDWLNLYPAEHCAEVGQELTAVNRERLAIGPVVNLPFAGEWTLWQGPDGPWTHQGLWRHGWDFYITDPEGVSHSEAEDHLESYFAYGAEILSPVAGRVVQAVGTLPDANPGMPDHEHRWGNMVVIRMPSGEHLVLAHLMKDSLQVHEGQEVLPGAAIGRCGNSGFSAQPHLHMHVQREAYAGAATMPMRFAPYRARGAIQFAPPVAGDRLEPVPASADLRQTFSFYPDEEVSFVCGGPDAPPLRLKVCMGQDGYCFFESSSGARLYFMVDAGRFLCCRVEGTDPSLYRLYRNLACAPFVEAEARWQDEIPVSYLLQSQKGTGIRIWLHQWLALLQPASMKQTVAYRLEGDVLYSRCGEGKGALEDQLLLQHGR